MLPVAPTRGGARRAAAVLIRSAALRGVRIAFLVTAVALSGYAVATRWDQVSAHLREIGTVRVLLCVPPMLGGLYCGMRAWRAVLAGLGSTVPTQAAARIYFVGQLGKYLPGAVWPVLAQVELGRDHDIPPRRSAGALVIAVLLSLATGGLLAGAVLIPVDPHRYAALGWLLPPAAALAALVSPPVLRAVLRRLPPALARLRSVLPGHLAGPAMAAAAGWTVLGWLSYGAHVAVLTAAFPTPGAGRLALAALGGYALAWLAGLVAFVLPAGAGARDLTLVVALAAVVSTNPAIAVAVVSRAVSTGCDLVLAAVAGAGVSVTAASR